MASNHGDDEASALTVSSIEPVFRPTSPVVREYPRQLNPPDTREEWATGAGHDGNRLFAITVLHGETNEQFGLQGAAAPPSDALDVMVDRLDAADAEAHHPVSPAPCERLNLACISLDQGCCAVLAHRLPALARGLRSLNLHACGFGDDGCATLVSALATLLLVESFYAGQCNIGDGGVAVLAPALALMSELKDVHLFGNTIGDGGAAVLAAKIGGLPKLRALDLAENKVGPGGILALGRAMQRAERTDIDCFGELDWRVCAAAMGAPTNFASDAHLYLHLFPDSGVIAKGDPIAKRVGGSPTKAAAQPRDPVTRV